MVISLCLGYLCLYLVVSLNFLELSSNWHGQFAVWDDGKNKTIVKFNSSLPPSGKLPV